MRRPPLFGRSCWAARARAKPLWLRYAKFFAKFWLGEDADAAGAPSHAAARLIGGRTLHSLDKLPRHSLADKTASLSVDAVRRLKEDRSPVQVVFRDEISMVGSDQYYQMPHRAVTAKGSHSTRDGRVLAGVGEVDQGGSCSFHQWTGFLCSSRCLGTPPLRMIWRSFPRMHIVPVLMQSVLSSLPGMHAVPVQMRSVGGRATTNDIRVQRYRYECYWGQQRWRDADVVTFLEANARSDRALARILAEMRECKLSTASYRFLQSRVVGASEAHGSSKVLPAGVVDPRLMQAPFDDPLHPPVHVVFRHSSRALLSYQNALRQVERLGHPLYVMFARGPSNLSGPLFGGLHNDVCPRRKHVFFSGRSLLREDRAPPQEGWSSNGPEPVSPSGGSSLLMPWTLDSCQQIQKLHGRMGAIRCQCLNLGC